MNMPTQAQIYAGLRYAGTAAGTVGTVVTLIGLLPADTSHALVAAFQTWLTDLQKLIGDSYVLVGIALPIITIWLGKIGWNSASPKKQIAAVQAMPAAQVTVTDPKLAEGIPGVKVEGKN